MALKFEFSLPIEHADLQSEDVRSILKKVDILIVTVNEAERASIFRLLLPIPEKNSILSINHQSYTYRIGRLGYHLVAHVQSQMGSIQPNASLLTVSTAIDVIKPKAVIMVGVAFGINPDKQFKGDVLISRSVSYYEVARINEKQWDITQRGITPISGNLLYNSFVNIIDWGFYVTRKRKARPLAGDLLSGEKLIDNLDYRNFLRDKFPTAIGGEMEGSGLSSACISKGLNEWIIIKGICDWGDGKKDKKFQPKAAAASMSLVFHALSIPTIFNGLEISVLDHHTVIAEKEKYTLNARKGSPLWVLNRIKSDALSKLIADIEFVSKTGYPDNIADAVMRDLNLLYDEVLDLPALYEGNAELRNLFTDFLNTFKSWRTITNAQPFAEQRRNKLSLKLSGIRENIARHLSQTQKSLSYNVADVNPENFINLLGITEEFPDLFPNLKKATKKIKRGIDSTK
ncbi:hypothetical protein KK083_15920 [Fulvivirgaceae bacterium PWU4]|uniref:Nucleoside phosphorylase domain-containing protein n=1 Tax=Chryseosolibacter histidini TaxID=2782349 RepID=A0AAP2GQC5_9BACT|nr:hypothetical protein [Chryseosolibacter histidini]MBT1698377.1 hypothetical protein [Chryseosolibacter histidini]